MNKLSESLADKAYQIIEEMIVTLQLPPGTVFSEADLVNKVNIGRTPLREALQRLANYRLISVLPRRGMIVGDINISDHLALLETRRVLDRLVASRAARRATSEQRDQLRECARSMEKAALDGNLTEFMSLDREFDQILGTASRNLYAAQVCTPLHSHCRRFWYYYKHNGDLTQAAQLHESLMNAVAEGDVEKAESSSDKLIDYLEEFAKGVLTDF
jgi:DNA-binding GntR family transcriptional regulator